MRSLKNKKKISSAGAGTSVLTVSQQSQSQSHIQGKSVIHITFSLVDTFFLHKEILSVMSSLSKKYDNTDKDKDTNDNKEYQTRVLTNINKKWNEVNSSIPLWRWKTVMNVTTRRK